MIERIAKNPLALAGLLVGSGAVGAVLVLGAQALLPGAASQADTARIGPIVRDYILEHPEILPEATQRLADRESAKLVAASRETLLKPFAGAWEGNPDGDVTVAVMMDYACGYCRASLPELAKLVASDPKVRIVYRELPVLSAASRTAAEWALAAAEQNKFKEFHSALYNTSEQLSDKTIAAAATTAGLDQAKATQAIKDPRIDAEITRNLEAASKLGVNGTPSWVIGDRVIFGMVEFDVLKEAVAAARAKL